MSTIPHTANLPGNDIPTSQTGEDAPGCDATSICNRTHADALWNARAALKAIRWDGGPDYALWRKVGLKRVMRFRAAAQGVVA